MGTYSEDRWTEAQWNQLQETVRDEAKKQRVAGSFLPLFGPLGEDEQTVALQTLAPTPVGTIPSLLAINDFPTRRLSTLSVNVSLSSAQVAQSDLATALVAFRRAANLIARAEDWIIFLCQPAVGAPGVLPGFFNPCELTGGQQFDGLATTAINSGQTRSVGLLPTGEGLVTAVTQATGDLETQGHLGPFAVVLNSNLFGIAHTPVPGSLVLPADRIRPMIDGPLLRSSTMDVGVPMGVVVSLGGDLIDLVVGREIAVCFVQVTVAAAPAHVYRVSERFTLRIKQPNAIVALVP